MHASYRRAWGSYGMRGPQFCWRSLSSFEAPSCYDPKRSTWSSRTRKTRASSACCWSHNRGLDDHSRNMPCRLCSKEDTSASASSCGRGGIVASLERQYRTHANRCTGCGRHASLQCQLERLGEHLRGYYSSEV